MNAPCFMCEKRSATCHSVCEDYKQFSQTCAARSHEKKVYNRETGYFISKARRLRKAYLNKIGKR